MHKQITLVIFLITFFCTQFNVAATHYSNQDIQSTFYYNVRASNAVPNVLKKITDSQDTPPDSLKHFHGILCDKDVHIFKIEGDSIHIEWNGNNSYGEMYAFIKSKRILQDKSLNIKSIHPYFATLSYFRTALCFFDITEQRNIFTVNPFLVTSPQSLSPAKSIFNARSFEAYAELFATGISICNKTDRPK